MSDLFSTQSEAYKKYRPVYPQALYDYIFSFVNARDKALDVATGNGQAAVALAQTFTSVIGIDSSAAQLARAEPKDNITYIQATAEQTFSNAHSFNLITVAQAYHWLQQEAFATEVKRIAKPGAVIAVWGYNRFITTNHQLDALLEHFYTAIVGPYWDAGRMAVDNQYRDLPFPYKPLPTKPFTIDAVWTTAQLLGYLSSWSAVQTYMQKNGTSPVGLIEKEVAQLMGDKNIGVQFPVFLRLGRIEGA
ncbi:MAG TPA: class I SAM-dependent methyltransferase [Chitinophagaceae bacterium]|nr:class I SAM-dependent methyltransferase [Chitinophagaceae bacterium]